MTLEQLNKQKIQDSKTAAIEICKTVLPMNYISDNEVISRLPEDDKRELAHTMTKIEKISDATKLAILPRAIMENYITSNIINNMAESQQQTELELRGKDDEIRGLKEVLQQNSLTYDSGELERIKEQNRIELAQRSKDRVRIREAAKATGLRYIGRL